MSKKRKRHLQAKLLLGLVSMAGLLILVLTPTVSELYRSRMEEYYTNLAFAQATVAADLIDGDRIGQYYTSGETDGYYDEVAAFMFDVKQKMNLEYFYVVVPEEDGMVYIWDAENGAGGYKPGETDPYYGGDDEAMHAAFAADGEQSIQITDDDDYGYLASAYVAIQDGDGTPVALACVDISMDMINAQIRQFVILTMGATLLVLLISNVAFCIYIRKILIRPLNSLHDATEDLVKSDMAQLESFNVQVNTRDEVQDLADAFRYMVVELNQYIRNLSRVTAEKERIGAELDVARHIQASLLPCIFPAFPERNEFDVYASMTPAKEVGGDFYDYFLVDDDHLALVMADVSGKGVPAALFMMISKTLIKTAAQSGISPRAVLEKVNNQLYENNDAEMFVTVWLGVLEISTGRMRCVNAGHEYPAIMHKDGSFELLRDRHGFVLAGMENSRYKEYELELHAGDRLFVYTDGIPEATDSAGTLYGTDRMLSALNSDKAASCRQILDIVHQSVDAFVGDAPQFDDMTMLCLEMKHIDSEMKKIGIVPTLDELPRAVAFFESFLDANDASGKLVAQLNVAVEEIFSNIARYSGATIATLGCRVSHGSIEMRFSDNGRPYDPTTRPDPDTTSAAEDRDIGGLGIFMVKKMMDDMRYEYGDGLNILTLVKHM